MNLTEQEINSLRQKIVDAYLETFRGQERPMFHFKATMGIINGNLFQLDPITFDVLVAAMNKLKMNMNAASEYPTTDVLEQYRIALFYAETIRGYQQIAMNLINREQEEKLREIRVLTAKIEEIDAEQRASGSV